MVEGSLWVYGNTSLSDYYAGRLTFRQVIVRLLALPAEAPFWAAMRDEYERAEADMAAAEVEGVLASFIPQR